MFIVCVLKEDTSSVRSGMDPPASPDYAHAAPDGACDCILIPVFYKHVAPPGLRLIWATGP